MLHSDWQALGRSETVIGRLLHYSAILATKQLYYIVRNKNDHTIVNGWTGNAQLLAGRAAH